MTGHLPVMLPEVLATLAPRDDAAYLDATFGGGGYAGAILEAAPRCTLYAMDRDPDAIARGAGLVARHAPRLRLIEGRFGDMLDLLAARGLTALDGVVMDLGVSSFQLDQAERGFSFRADGPLDMRMEKAGPSAADLVNTLPEAELADILYRLGEERFSRRIAKRFMAEAAGRGTGASRHDPGALAARTAPRFRLLTSRALRPSEAETRDNPRARSARLRALERLEEAA